MVPQRSVRIAMDVLIDRLGPSLPGSVLGEILNRLVWLTDDNGTDLVAVLREWLGDTDKRRVEAALSFDEGWLYEDKANFLSKAEAAGNRWPDLLPRIQQISRSYERKSG